MPNGIQEERDQQFDTGLSPIVYGSGFRFEVMEPLQLLNELNIVATGPAFIRAGSHVDMETTGR